MKEVAGFIFCATPKCCQYLNMHFCSWSLPLLNRKWKIGCLSGQTMWSNILQILIIKPLVDYKGWYWASDLLNAEQSVSVESNIKNCWLAFWRGSIRRFPICWSTSNFRGCFSWREALLAACVKKTKNKSNRLFWEMCFFSFTNTVKWDTIFKS